jgi:toluene monooxygenase system ferredoxin subunit
MGVVTSSLRSLLKGSDLFRGVSQEHLRRLAPLVEVAPLASGQPLFQMGQPATHLYIVVQGIVSLELSFRACTHIVEICGPGKALGWPSLRPDATYFLTARPIRDGKVIVLEAAQLRAVMKRYRTLSLVIYKNLADILGRRWEALAFSEAREDTMEAVVERCPVILEEPGVETYLTKEEVQSRCIEEGLCVRFKGETCPLDDLTPADWYQASLHRIPLHLRR